MIYFRFIHAELAFSVEYQLLFVFAVDYQTT